MLQLPRVIAKLALLDVAVVSKGNLASATSTGGLVNKMVGEAILRGIVAREVAAPVEFKGLSLKETAAYPVDQAPPGTVGLVAVSSTGEVAMPFNTPGMFRACATKDGYSEIAI
ncbi:hypothetical protein PTKIN_Ptkin05aG0183100 [Pterospermum kingtungense]